MLFPPRWNCVRLAGFVEMKRLLNSSFSLILIVKLNIAFCDEQQNFITLNWKWNKSRRTQNVLSISNSSYLLHREVKYSVIIKGKKSLKLVSVWSRLCKNIKKYSKIDKRNRKFCLNTCSGSYRGFSKQMQYWKASTHIITAIRGAGVNILIRFYFTPTYEQTIKTFEQSNTLTIAYIIFASSVYVRSEISFTKLIPHQLHVSKHKHIWYMFIENDAGRVRLFSIWILLKEIGEYILNERSMYFWRMPLLHNTKPPNILYLHHFP